MASRTAGIVVCSALGAAVVGSYIYLAQRPDANMFWGGLKGKLLVFWAISALITALSFLYIWTYVYFLADAKMTNVWNRSLHDSYGILLAIYSVFMFSAACWVAVSVLAKNGVSWASKAVTAVLWSTAISSMALFVFLIGLREMDTNVTTAKAGLAILAGSFLFAHHLTWDAEIWRSTWEY